MAIAVDFAAEFGPRLRSAREQHQLSQDGLARELKVSKTAIQNWEAGKHLPRLDQYHHLCRLFGWESPFAFSPELMRMLFNDGIEARSA